MANDPDFINYVCDQVGDRCELSFRHMFGGTTLYSRGKVVALICDNQLFVKPTNAGRSYIGEVTEAPAYEGAKNFFLIGDEIDDGEWLTELIAITEHELPRPKPKRQKKKAKQEVSEP
ncbi:MAG TPA: TfoX/Sxy family protein [Woeseiaceae bacterium]|nr:TfoX/Sxy family protein [Woeseiaceae bacterium]